MKTIVIIIEISVFILTLASIPLRKKAAYKRVYNLSYAGLSIRLKRSVWCTFANADEVSIKIPPPSMESRMGLFKSFKGAMLMLMLITASIAVVIVYPFLIYASITDNVSVFDGILLIIMGSGGCAAMALCASYSLFIELALRDRIIELCDSGV